MSMVNITPAAANFDLMIVSDGKSGDHQNHQASSFGDHEFLQKVAFLHIYILKPDTHLNSLSGHFMYVDSIYAKTFKEVAKLVSPLTTVPMSGCLSFQYQRSEERGNLFSVFTRDRLGQYQELWRAGPEIQSDWSRTLGEWIPVQVDLKAPYSVQVSMNISCQLRCM